MQPDGTDSSSTADEKRISPKGKHVTEPNRKIGSEVKNYLHSDGTTWSYLFVHHNKVKTLEELLERDKRTYFVHRTVRYFQNPGKHKVRSDEMPSVSGLVFLQGRPLEIQSYLSDLFPYLYLCKDCSTGRVAQIPDSQMRPFMRITNVAPERVRFLLHPFHYYARNRILLRITCGELEGLEGYVIRIDRDRRLVMNIGGLSVAIGGVHAEHFEEVEQPQALADENIFYQRNLQERQVLIDRYFHPVKNEQDVAAQAEDIDYLRKYALSELECGHITLRDAWNICSFVIEEIAYYYAPVMERFKERLDPIFREGGKVLQELERIAADPRVAPADKERYAADYQRILSQHGYLFTM